MKSEKYGEDNEPDEESDLEGRIESRRTAKNTQRRFAEIGIELTLDEAQECADNLKAFFDLLNKWDMENKQAEEDRLHEALP